MQPINLSASDDFETWAENRLSLYTEARIQQLLEPVNLSVTKGFSIEALNRLLSNIRDFSLSLYQVVPNQDLTLESISLMADQLGLITLDKHLCASEDCISLITNTSSESTPGDVRRRYIPYSNRALSWHTDGYYNPYHQRVQAFILHCQQAASNGGGNSFIDPEVVYILLRRENPAYIEALCHPEVMRIPANIDGETSIRAETASSVFQLDETGYLSGMRFSQRKRHIIWRDDPLTRDALACLNDLLDNESMWRIDCKLEAGQGVISNNVLHRRQAYEDDNGQKRLYIRARYYNPIQDNQAIETEAV